MVWILQAVGLGHLWRYKSPTSRDYQYDLSQGVGGGMVNLDG